MVKVILFDYWGTLVEQGEWSPIKQVRNILQIRMPFSEYVVRFERAFMTQKFDSLREAFENVCKEFNVEPREYLLEKLIGMWNKNWMLSKIYDNTQEVLASLKEDFRLVLISNTDSVAVEKSLEKVDITQYFEKIFFSYEIGLIKTDSAFLEKVLQELQVDANECLLVGDSIKSDMEAGQNAGMNVLLIDRRDKREFSPKVISLEDISSHIKELSNE